MKSSAWCFGTWFFDFPYSGKSSQLTDVFQRGGYTTNQSSFPLLKHWWTPTFFVRVIPDPGQKAQFAPFELQRAPEPEPARTLTGTGCPKVGIVTVNQNKNKLWNLVKLCENCIVVNDIEWYWMMDSVNFDVKLQNKVVTKRLCIIIYASLNPCVSFIFACCVLSVWGDTVPLAKTCQNHICQFHK